MNEQERADKLSESIDKLMAGRQSDGNDPLMDIARQLATAKYQPSRQAQVRFNRRVNEWFAEDRKPVGWFNFLPLRSLAAALIVILVIGLVFQSGVLKRLSSPDSTSTSIPLSTTTTTATITVTNTASSTATPSPSPSRTASATSTSTITPTTIPTSTMTPTRLFKPTAIPTVSGGAPTDDHGGNSGSDSGSSGNSGSGSGSSGSSGGSGSDDSGHHSGSDG